MGITVYLIAALVFVGALAGAGYKGYQAGADHERVANLAAVEASRNEAEAKRAAEATKARKLAAGLQTALTKQKGLSRDLGNALESHIRALPAPPAGCPAPALSDSLLDDWNAANHATSDPAGGGVPGSGGTAPAPAGAVPSSGDPQPR